MVFVPKKNAIRYSVNILSLPFFFLAHAHKPKFRVYLLIYCDRPFFLSFVYYTFGLSFLYLVSFVAQFIVILSRAIVAGQLSRKKGNFLSGKRSMWIAKLAVDFPKNVSRFLCLTLARLVRISKMTLLKLVAYQSYLFKSWQQNGLCVVPNWPILIRSVANGV